MRHQLRPSLAALLLAFLLTGPPLLAQQPPAPPAPAAPAPAAPAPAPPAPPIERSAPAFPYAVAVGILVLFLVIVCMPSRKA